MAINSATMFTSLHSNTDWMLLPQ